MNRHCLDVRIWAPLLVATAAVLLRGGPSRPATRAVAPRCVEVPALHAAAEPRDDADYVLDAGLSSVRFLVEGNGTQRLAACPRVAGHLRLRDGGSRRELELVFDLGSLQAVGSAPASLDLWQLLGVHRSSEICYRASLLRTSTSTLPGVTQRLWSGTLRLDDRVVRQPIQLWQVTLPGQPLRLQGHGSVTADTYGLPSHGWLGIHHQPPHVVTLGLDLAWRRQRGH